MRNHQYLELMGIDVWRRRPPRQSKAELEAVVAMRADSTTGLPSEVPTGIPTGVPSDRKAGQSSEKVAAGTSNLAQVRQSLGVSEQPSVKAPTSNVAAFPPVQLGPSFLLIFTHFPCLTIASSYSADLARLPDHHQRFLTSLYFALRGEKSAPRISDFRWPMVKSAHISQSKEEARQVLQQNLGNLENQILSFGDEPTELIHGQAVATYQPIQLADKAAGKTLWSLPEIDHFFSASGERKVLWQGLKELRGAIRRE